MRSFVEKPKLPAGAVWVMNRVAEAKGKQALFARQAPQLLTALRELALVESAESSNRIEGIEVAPERLRPIVLDHARPRDRAEEEVAGYRRALDLVHRKYADLPINAATIRRLHGLCVAGAADAGQWKTRDNDIIRKHPDGRVELWFKPLAANATPAAMAELCRLYQTALDRWRYPDLYAIACLVLDFLCVHPFRDGNGRVSRLLTLLALYQQGFEVGKYISLERIIEESRETYYESLHRSSEQWHRGKHDLEPWLGYFLGTVSAAYRQFEERARDTGSPRGTKSALIRRQIEAQTGDFTLREVLRVLPGISTPLVKRVFRQMEQERVIACLGKGRSARWRRMGYSGDQ